MGRQERYVVGLDIGTSKVCTVVGEILETGGVDVVGIGVAESKGLKRGVVVNLDAAVESIKTSIEEAEDRGHHEVLNWFCLAGAMHELGHQKPDESVFLESWISNSDKVFAVFRPNHASAGASGWLRAEASSMPNTDRFG